MASAWGQSPASQVLKGALAGWAYAPGETRMRKSANAATNRTAIIVVYYEK